MELLPIRRALLSVTHKEGLDVLGKFLHENGVELVSTGGTLRFLRDCGLPVTAVSDVTGFPEILDGRVKTLHPRIHGGILADKDNPEHLATLARHDILPFDLVCVNLYDFASAVSRQADLRDAIEQIDIGGPCLLRATAKNCHSTVVIPDAAGYAEVMEEMKAHDMCVTLQFRIQMAVRTYKLTSEYDRMIADYLGRNL